MITRDRPGAIAAVEGVLALPEAPRLVVVDNASSTTSPEQIESRFPHVSVVRLPRNIGAAARNVGAAILRRPYIAFCDDDVWWQPGSLRLAADLLDAHPTLALIAARVLVGKDDRLDPTSLEMAQTRLSARAGLPGRPILGFIAGAAVVRRDAFLAAGGFERRMMVGGEETLLAVDLARAGCDLAYVEDVVAHHHPSPARDPVRRRAIMRRNALWTAWLRRSPSRAAAHTVRLARDAVRDPASLRALAEAAQAAGWAMRRRRAVPAALDRELDLVRTQ